jgi:hypothetical protein
VSSIVDRISLALSRALAATRSPEEPIESATGPDLGISPWALWLLFGLIRHEPRQRWVAQIAGERLGADLRGISTAGAFAHPEDEDSGLVPGLTDWMYSFHGRGCCLTSRLTGESIDVDFYDGTAEWFDDYFYLNFLRSLKQPEFVEQRIIALHPTLDTALLAFDELCELGLLEKHPDSKVVRLHESCRDWREEVDQIASQPMTTEQSAALGMALGDWLLAREHSSGIDLVMARARECIDERVRHLTELLSASPNPVNELRALADLNPPQLRSVLEGVLHGPPSGAISAALRIIEQRAHEDWTERVSQLLDRINPNGDIPEPHILLACAAYLLRRQVRIDDVRRKLADMTQRELGDAALLALEHLLDLALILFRRALRSRVPCDRTTAAAALAVLDQPWSRTELQRVLHESDDQLATAECRAALRALPHPELHDFVRQWEAKYPHEPETGKFISMAEMSLRTRDSWIQHEMSNLHERVVPLRDRTV